MRIVDEATLRQTVGEADAFEAAETAFRALAEGTVEQPPPMALEIPERGGEVHVKGAYLRGAPVFAVKVAAGFYENAARGLPTGSGLVLVFDAATGFPLALLDDKAYLTDLRTAAAGALAARHLAPRDVETVAIVGSGVQARFQLRAISRIVRWRQAAAWSPRPDRLAAYCREMESELGRPVRPAPSVREALAGARLVVTATPSRRALVRAPWLAPGSTVIAVGSDGPEKIELEPEVLAAADKLVVDRLEQCARLGELHHALAAGLLRETDVYAELGEIVVGRKAGREADERIVCDLTGVGAQDAAIAEVAWRRLVATDGALSREE